MTNKKVLDAVQTMAEKEYIERGALKNVLEAKADMAVGTPKEVFHHVAKMLDLLPAADVVEVRHGEWLETQEPLGWRDVDCIECSVCHESWIMNEDSSIDDYECMWHHCPNCGAKMDERSKK